MKTDGTPLIYSFIIRFVVEESPDPGQPAAYHGAIRHIQSAEELHFTEWTEAVEFMHRYVPIDSMSNNPDP